MYDISEQYANDANQFLTFLLVWFMTNTILCTQKPHLLCFCSSYC